jgi:hypothetical protein
MRENNNSLLRSNAVIQIIIKNLCSSSNTKIFYDYLNDCIGAQKTVVVLSHDPAIIKGAGTLIDLDNYQVVSETPNFLSSKQES